MKSLKSFSHLLVIIVLIGCSSSKIVLKREPGKIYFTLLQLNDVYEIAPIQGGEYGGMARVETIHQELLKENPNTMLVLAGDFLNPSLLGTMKVDGERVRGKQMVEVLNAMNTDLVCFGNHEFDLSYTHLQERLNESNFEWISANVLHNRNGQSHYFHKVRDGKKETINDSYIQEFYDTEGVKVRVGFISVCIPSNPRNYVKYEDVFIEIERAYNEIKDKVDVVIGLTHVSIAQDKQIAKLLPNIPLIMGGHEHTNTYKKVGNVTIAKADANAKTVYIHRLSYDKSTKEVALDSELKEINKGIVQNVHVAKVVEKWQTILKSKIKDIIPNPEEIIYKADIPLDARDTPIRSKQTNMGGLITKSMSHAFNDTVDCALVNGGSIRIDDVLKGAITAVDIFRVLPYGGAILKVAIKGNLLRKVLDYGESATGTGAYLQRYNVVKVGEKWQVNNQPILTEKTYMVAFSDYLLKGFDIPFLSEKNPEVVNIYKPKVEELGYDIRRAVVEYLKK